MKANITTITQWVNNQYDTQELHQIIEHGCVSGCASGMVYYFETGEFYEKFKDEIWNMLYESAEDQGVTTMQLISSFNGQDNVGSDCQLKNILAWYAVEETARTILGSW